MWPPPSPGHRTWECECGRMHLALALGECPDCGSPRPEAEARVAVPADVPAAAPVPSPAPRRRTRARR